MGSETGDDMTLTDRFKNALLYAITCPPSGGPGGYDAMVRAACEGGADILQFRGKDLAWKVRYEIAGRLRKICAGFGVLFIVNDATDLALATQADGVHLGQDDLPLPVARELVKRASRADFLIGKSTHSLEQALEAEREGADYVGIGPIFATPTKPTYNPVGLDLIGAVKARVRVPHVAIGGINATNVADVLAAGAELVAVVRAVCGAGDIAAAARQMKTVIESARRKHDPSPPSAGVGGPTTTFTASWVPRLRPRGTTTVP
jgi:thiamine-phosphate pyrophosphorylase